MLADQRRQQLLEMVRVRGFASLPELAETFSVSASTIRRDVDLLEEQGAVSRVHGGVVYTGTSPKLPHFDASDPARWEQKRAIARRAVELVEDGDTVLLDGGSTTYELGRLLVGRSLHVVTNSLPVANLFASDTRSDLVWIGGNVCPRSGVALGPYADKMLAMIRVRKTILSVAAVNHEGFFNDNLLLVETERAMMRAADEVIVVADSSKFGHRSLTHLCGLGAVHWVVADAGIAESWKSALEAAGVRVLVGEDKAIGQNESRNEHCPSDRSGRD
jgi:DeoR/GlpR family transcriptional regulator of sugar metabolism